MLGKTHLFLGLGAALCGGLCLAHAPGDAPARLGFVNVVELQKQYRSYRDSFAKLKGDYAREKKKLLEKSEDIRRRWRQDLPLYEQGSAEWDGLKMELQLADTEVELKLKNLQKKSEKQQLDLLDSFFRDVIRVVEAYAKKQGYQCIFMHRPLAKVRRLEDLIHLNNQWVLYRDEALDITAEIVKLLNKPGKG